MNCGSSERLETDYGGNWIARQNKDWGAIITLWDEATGKGLRPYNGLELLPFIEAYANQQKWEDAFKLTVRANKITEAMYFLLCPTWERLSNETPPGEAKDEFFFEAYQTLKCAVP